MRVLEREPLLRGRYSAPAPGFPAAVPVGAGASAELASDRRRGMEDARATGTTAASTDRQGRARVVPGRRRNAVGVDGAVGEDHVCHGAGDGGADGPHEGVETDLDDEGTGNGDDLPDLGRHPYGRLGPVRRIFVSPRRLARRLAALSRGDRAVTWKRASVWGEPVGTAIRKGTLWWSQGWAPYGSSDPRRVRVSPTADAERRRARRRERR